MPIDCSNVPTDQNYDCSNPWGQNCTSARKFDFVSLWNYTQKIQQYCANDTRLFRPHGGFASPRNASLTQEACTAMAGSEWKRYPTADIWTRLTTWKFPLLQLVASFPRPPLSLSVECFVILHLVGDPMDTLMNLLAKMSACQLVAERWRAQCKDIWERESQQDKDWDWKALALLTDAYGEWGMDEGAIDALLDGLRAEQNLGRKDDMATTIHRTGRALAADRSTKFLPIIVAQAFFIGAVGIAVFKTKSAAGATASSDTVFINVEAHSIAFSALYFWIIPVVFVGSIIGVSQTQAAIPRILKRFQVDLDRLNLPKEIRMPNELLRDDDQRIFHGGIYSWQPQTSTFSYIMLPLLVMIVATTTGLLVSGFVPPDGFHCRSKAELLISAVWLVSSVFNVVIKCICRSYKLPSSSLFWTTLFKDVVAIIASMGGIILTQVGIYNRRSCYSLQSTTGLALPEMPDVAETLFHRLSTIYPAVTFSGISIELVVIPLFICLRYFDALRTFVQRDDRKSNAPWLWKFLERYRTLKAKIERMMPRDLFKLSRLKRTNTVTLEEMPPKDSDETQPLTHSVSGGADSTVAEDGNSARMLGVDGHSEPTGSTSHTQGANLPSASTSKLQ